MEEFAVQLTPLSTIDEALQSSLYGNKGNWASYKMCYRGTHTGICEKDLEKLEKRRMQYCSIVTLLQLSQRYGESKHGALEENPCSQTLQGHLGYLP